MFVVVAAFNLAFAVELVFHRVAVRPLDIDYIGFAFIKPGGNGIPGFLATAFIAYPQVMIPWADTQTDMAHGW